MHSYVIATGLSALLKELLYLHEVYTVYVHLKRTVVIKKFMLISILYCQSLGHHHYVNYKYKSLDNLLQYSLIYVKNFVNQSLKFHARILPPSYDLYVISVGALIRTTLQYSDNAILFLNRRFIQGC